MQGRSRVVKCLQGARAQLSPQCAAVLFDHELLISESVRFNRVLKRRCAVEIGKHCEGVPEGKGDVLRCLQDRQSAPGFGDECQDVRSDHLLAPLHALAARFTCVPA